MLGIIRRTIRMSDAAAAALVSKINHMALRKQPKLIWVQWVDSHSWDAWGEHKEEVDTRCETVGWLIEETATKLRLGHSRTLDDQCEPWAGVVDIPKLAIVARKTLRSKLHAPDPVAPNSGS